MVILRPHKIYFKITKVTGDRDGHFIMMKGTLHQEDITLLNVHEPNQGAPKYIKQLLIKLKGETDKKHNCSRGTKYSIDGTALDRSSDRRSIKNYWP